MTDASNPVLTDTAVPAAVAARTASGPWQRSWRILKRDRATLLAAAVLILIILSSLAAPFYARYVSGTDPLEEVVAPPSPDSSTLSSSSTRFGRKSAAA